MLTFVACGFWLVVLAAICSELDRHFPVRQSKDDQ